MMPKRLLFVLAIMLLQGGCRNGCPGFRQMCCPLPCQSTSCPTCVAAGCSPGKLFWFKNFAVKAHCDLKNIEANLKCSRLLWVFSKPRVYEPKSYPSIRGFSPVPDDYAVSEAANRLSKKSLRDLQCRYPKDFKDGFRQAYLDIANGGAGETPPIPPEKYWKAHYRTLRGHERAQQWFEGYRLGAQQARADGISDFNTIPTSAYPGYVEQTRGGWIQPTGPLQSGCSTCNQQLNAPVPIINGGPMINAGVPAHASPSQYDVPNDPVLPTNVYRRQPPQNIGFRVPNNPVGW